jgi:hypothetical protein
MLAEDTEVRLNVRMPKSEYRKLKRFAFDKETSISEVVRSALREYVSK